MTPESPAIAVNRLFSGQAVTEVWERMAQKTGSPQVIQVAKSDVGPLAS